MWLIFGAVFADVLCIFFHFEGFFVHVVGELFFFSAFGTGADVSHVIFKQYLNQYFTLMGYESLQKGVENKIDFESSIFGQIGAVYGIGDAIYSELCSQRLRF